MGEVIRYIGFFVAAIIIAFAVLFSDSFVDRGSSYIIQSVFKAEDYKYWKKIDGSFFCQESSEQIESLRDAFLTEIQGEKVNIVYLTNVDVIQCSRYLEEIALKFQDFGVFFAIDLEKNFNSSSLFQNDFTVFNAENYISKFKDYSAAAGWISYIVVDDKSESMTFLERRQFLSLLRDVFTKSFIGFRFDNIVKPTPEMTHPLRKNTSWNQFEPKDEDGDFIISAFPVNELRRTAIYSENLAAITLGTDGQFLN